MHALKSYDFFSLTYYSLDIDYSESEGFKCSTRYSRLTKVVTIANAWTDALCKVFNKDTKQSIFRHFIIPSKTTHN